jgi:hypothetical protein
VRAGVAMVAAVVLWLVPIPPALIEHWYSRGIYLFWQRVATAVANLLPFAIFDALLLSAALVVTMVAVRARRARSWGYAAQRLLLVAAVAALWFQVAWGLNYRRVPIAQSMRLDTGALVRDALPRFAAAAADAAAASADQLDRENPLTPSRVMADLSNGFLRAQRLAGLQSFARPGRPKHSLFDVYFRTTAIDGVTNPFVPETIVVSGLVPAEIYATVAHEWAHLAGYASEDEANFVAWLACLEAGGGPRYNAWLFALIKASSFAPDRERRAWLARAGPIAAGDLQAIRHRLQRSSPVLREAAASAYDGFLRANRVADGIASYDNVLRLMLAYDARR